MVRIPRRQNLRNVMLLLAVSLPLSGCFVPPLVSIAAVAFDAGSFAATGKSAKDHGISLVAQEDCALLRVFEGEVCRPYSDYNSATAVAALEPLGPVDENWADATNALPLAIGDGPLRDLDFVASASDALKKQPPQLRPQTASLSLDYKSSGEDRSVFLGGYLSDSVEFTY